MNKAVIVAGMAYGDEAKGATVDFLCRSLGAGLVVRYNGGHQAAHNVVLEDGRHHTFSQFGSGSFVPDVRTHLSRFMLINPAAMIEEEEHLYQIGVKDAWNRTTVDAECVIVTPYHRAFNRLEEISRGHRAHGSCGMGIGVTRRLELNGLALRAGDINLGTYDYRTKLLQIKATLYNELRTFRYQLEDTAEVQAELSWFDNVGEDVDQITGSYKKWPAHVVLDVEIGREPVIFEGAQGVLLDEKHGVAPHNTWTNTTFDNAQAILAGAKFDGEVTKLGCWRSYFTRHGNGPFRTEFPSGADFSLEEFPELHNTNGRYQGKWRIGGFDHDLAIEAVKICGGIDEIAISHLDVVSMDIDFLAVELQAPVTVLGYGPTAGDRKV